jgi:hypothetical protein
MSKILIDSMPLTFSLVEDEGKTGKLVARGQFACVDRPTENKRLYKRSLWEREIKRTSESMQDRRVLGELDHPADGRTKLVRVSHLMTSLNIDGDEVIGEAEIMDTPNGRILKAILQAGAKVGVSSRGFGTTKTIAGGIEEVQEDFRLDTFDFVADPATKTAYPQIFAEEREKIPEDGMELTLESLKRDYPGLVEALSKEAQAAVLTESSEKHGKVINEAVTAAEERTEKRLRERFSTDLRRHIEKVDEAAREKALSEALSDPNVAGAKQILERIATIIAPFGVPMDQQKVIAEKDDRIAKLEASLAERELEVQAARAETAEFKKVATEAAYRLHLERMVAEDDARDTIIKLVGSLSQYKSPDEIAEKVDAIRGTLTAVVEKQEQKTESVKIDIDGRLTEMEQRLQAAEKRAKVAEERESQANARAEKAVTLAETMQIQMYVESVVSGHEDADTLRKLCESAESTEEVDAIVTEHAGRKPQRRLDEDEAARIRARVSKGRERSLEEDTHGKNGGGDNKSKDAGGNPLAEFGMTEDQFDTFAGTRKLRS